MEFMKISAAPEDSQLLLSCFTRAEKRIPASAVRAEVRICRRMDADPASELRELRRKYGRDAICPFLADKNGWRCVCGTHNPPQNEVCALCGRDRGAASRSELTQSHVREAQGLANAADILRYVSGLGLADTEHTQKLLQALQKARLLQKEYMGITRRPRCERSRRLWMPGSRQPGSPVHRAALPVRAITPGRAKSVLTAAWRCGRRVKRPALFRFVIRASLKSPPPAAKLSPNVMLILYNRCAFFVMICYNDKWSKIRTSVPCGVLYISSQGGHEAYG